MIHIPRIHFPLLIDPLTLLFTNPKILIKITIAHLVFDQINSQYPNHYPTQHYEDSDIGNPS